MHDGESSRLLDGLLRRVLADEVVQGAVQAAERVEEGQRRGGEVHDVVVGEAASGL